MLENKTVLVSGATSGIGKACALALAKQGAQLILLASCAKKLAKTGEEISQYNCPEPLLCPFNLLHATAEHYLQLTEELTAKYDHLDGLIHCAGKLDKLTPLEYTSMLQWQSLIQINLNSRFLLTQACLPLLRSARKSQLLFVLSQKARQAGQAHWGPYQVSDHGTRALFEILAEELENTPVNVNAIELPPCDTPLRRRVYPFEDQSQLSQPHDFDCMWTQLFQDEATPQHGLVISHA